MKNICILETRCGCTRILDEDYSKMKYIQIPLPINWNAGQPIDIQDIPDISMLSTRVRTFEFYGIRHFSNSRHYVYKERLD